MESESTDNNMYSVNTDNGVFERLKTQHTTKRLAQAIVITDTELYKKCTPAGWHLVGLICSQLKEYNALWVCDKEIKKNSTHRRAIKELITNKILIKTETTDIYLVNPLHIRRGEFYTVLSTTARLLEKTLRVLPEHFVNKKPVDKLDYSNIGNAFINNNKQLGYGYD